MSPDSISPKRHQHLSNRQADGKFNTARGQSGPDTSAVRQQQHTKWPLLSSLPVPQPSTHGTVEPSSVENCNIALSESQNQPYLEDPLQSSKVLGSKQADLGNSQPIHKPLEPQRIPSPIDLVSPGIPAKPEQSQRLCAEADVGNQQGTQHCTPNCLKEGTPPEPKLSGNSDESVPETLGEFQSKQLEDGSHRPSNIDPGTLGNVSSSNLQQGGPEPPDPPPANARQQGPEARPASSHPAQITSQEEQNKRARRKSEALHFVTQIMQPW